MVYLWIINDLNIFECWFVYSCVNLRCVSDCKSWFLPRRLSLNADASYCPQNARCFGEAIKLSHESNAFATRYQACTVATRCSLLFGTKGCTQHLKIGFPSGKLIFQPVMFKGYVSFRKGNILLTSSAYSAIMEDRNPVQKRGYSKHYWKLEAWVKHHSEVLLALVRKAPSQKSFHTCQCPCRKSKSYMKTHSGLYCPTKESLSAISYKPLSDCKDPPTSITYPNSNVFFCFMFLELFSKLHGIYITFFQQTLEPWWETTSRVLPPVGRQVAQRIRQWVMPVPKPSQIIFSKKPLPFIKIVSGYNWYNKKWK